MSISKPYITCEFCNNVCDFRKQASAVTKSQSKFVIEAYTQLREGNLDSVATKSMMKSAELLKTSYDPSSVEQRGLAYCLIAHLTEDLDLKEEIKTTTMRSAKDAVINLFKNSVQMKAKSEVKKIDTKEIDAFGLSVDEENEKPESLSEQRRKIREQKTQKTSKSQKSKTTSPAESVASLKSTRASIYNWMNSDKSFLKMIAKDGIKEVEKGFLIILNPESEGYLSKIELQFVKKSFSMGDSRRSVIKIRYITSYDVKYNYDIAIGLNSKKKPIIASFLEPIPKEPSEILKEITEAQIDEGIGERDPLWLILDNDKNLKKNISKLPLKTPLKDYVESINLPILMIHDKEKMNIFLTAFLDERIKISKIIEVMEIIAEDLDNLYDIDESVRLRPSVESKKFLDENFAPKFHFIETGASISVPTCPNCNKPFSDPIAEYRRCPHCLFKLM